MNRICVPLRASGLIFVAILVGMSLGLSAQEQEQLLDRDEARAIAVTATEAAALDAANAAILRRNPRVTEDARVEAVALNRSPSGKYDLVFRYRLGWIEWSLARLLDVPEDLVAEAAARAAEAIDLAPLQLQILSRDAAERLVQSCDARIGATVIPLTPPFYRRLTNVRWDERANAPMLRSGAVISRADNLCVRTDLNLVTGETTCRRDIACTVD